MKVIRLKPGKERSLLRRHPWIYDAAIAKGKADPGETVRVESDSGQFLAFGAYSPTSKIRVRVWSFDADQRIDEAFFQTRLQASVATRARLDVVSNGVRLVHGESDGLPGVIVDRYDQVLVTQFLSAGAERWKQTIADQLLALTGLTHIYERSDSGVRGLEGLEPVKGWLRGDGDTARTIQEYDWLLSLDVEEGHKTGFYLDQRDSRKQFADTATRLQLRDMLNCYCYTGGFTVAAAAGMRTAGVLTPDTRITSIDSSASAIARAKNNLTLNGLDELAHIEFMVADVNASLRHFIKAGRQFDGIVLDPPKFAPTAAHAERAARAYKDINRLAFKLLTPGGVLFTYSCSGGIGVELFHKIVASAANDAGVDAHILERLGGAPDHPMTTAFPEGEYLKGLVLMKSLSSRPLPAPAAQDAPTD
jgi:23S rRNA (cytosine1962-C5)-methyltransferase